MVMKSQGNVGIFSRVLGRSFKIDLIKTNLMNTFAADLFVLNGLDTQMALG
ncbi:MAG: hypothetical protein RL533_996 [Pseudomonadota bacterium]